MTDSASAAEHLRVIRSLMERGTIYRAISAPTAMIGGLLSLGTGLWLARTAAFPSARGFISVWTGVLVAVLAANTFFIWRKSRSEHGPILTSGLKWAIRSAAPAFVIAGVLTVILWRNNETGEALPLLVLIWILCYGLALLGTASFSPRSLVLLGWVFLFTGSAGMLWISSLFRGNSSARANIAMALTFGVLHLVYAVLTWPRQSQAE